jgi:hypothetical protein
MGCNDLIPATAPVVASPLDFAALAEPVLNPVVADLPGGFGEIDECFEGLDLAEEKLVLPVEVVLMLQELASDLSDP